MSGFYEETLVKSARKPHLCEEACCKRTAAIRPGDSYVRCTGVDDGLYSIALCLRCRRLRDKVLVRYPPACDGEELLYGGLLEYVQEARRR